MRQRDVEIGRVHRVLEAIARAPAYEDHVVICWGATHAKIADGDGVKLLHSASGVEGVWKFLPLPKPGFFVARVGQARVLEFFRSIDDYACVAFAIVPEAREQFVIDAIVEDRNPFRSPIPDLPDQLVYFIDSDNPESSTGIAEAISVGSESRLRDALVLLAADGFQPEVK